MKLICVKSLCAAMMLAMAVADARAEPGGPPSGVSVEQFAAERCADCHGAGGQGSNPMVPKLAGQRPEYLFREMLKFRSGLRKGTLMQVHLGNLEDRDIAVLARYFGALRRLPDSGDIAPPDEAGRLLYVEGNAARSLPACATCHGFSALGSHRALPMPRLTGQHAAYIESQLFRFVEGARLRGQSSHHPIADRLDDDEISSVSRYISRIE